LAKLTSLFDWRRPKIQLSNVIVTD